MRRVLRRSIVLGVCLAGLAQASEEDFQKALGDLSWKSGDDYLRARDEFVAGAVREGWQAMVESRRRATDDPTEELWLECIADRVSRPGQGEAIWRESCKQASLPQPTIVGPTILPPMRQAEWAARRIVHLLGEKAPAYAAEAIDKQLARGIAEWEEYVPIFILGRFGWERDPKSSSRSPRFFPPREPRAGLVLFGQMQRMIDAGADEDLIDTVAEQMMRFSSPELLEAVKSARADTDPAKANRLSDVLARLDENLIEPSLTMSRPAESDKPRFGPPEGWRDRLKRAD